MLSRRSLLATSVTALGSPGLAFAAKAETPPDTPHLHKAAAPGGMAMPYVAKFNQTANVLDFIPYPLWIAGDYQVIVPTDENIGDEICGWLAGGGGGSLGNKVHSGRSLEWPARELVFAEQGSWDGSRGIMPGSGALFLRYATGWSIIGKGGRAGISRLTVPAASGLAGLGISDCDEWRIQGLHIDGKRPTMPTSGFHNIRLGGECDNWQVVDFASIDSPGYAFAAQSNSSSDSIFTRGTITDFLFEGPSNDGFDMKNAHGGNKHITLSNGVIKNVRRNGVTGECAMIDLRQATIVSDIWLIQEDLPGGVRSVDTSAFRCRSSQGGGEKTLARNLHIWMTTHADNITEDVPNIGIDIEDHSCQIEGVYVADADYGASFGGGVGNSQVDGIVTEGCRFGLAGIGDDTCHVSRASLRNSVFADIAGVMSVSDSYFGMTDEHVIHGIYSNGNLDGLRKDPTGAIEWLTAGASRLKLKPNGRIAWTNLPDFADDAAAALGGVELGEMYRAGNEMKIRAL